MDRSNLKLRKKIVRWYLGVLPFIAFSFYLMAPNFVVLIMIGGLTSAIFLPIQSGATLWLQATNMDERIKPSRLTYYSLWLIFFFELTMAVFVIWFVVLPPIMD